MSELTPCNYCTLNGIKYRAKKQGLTVTVKPDSHGWTSVYVHPPGVELKDDDESEYRQASMMALTDHCVC